MTLYDTIEHSNGGNDMSTKILTKTLHILNNEEETVQEKNIQSLFDTFINQVIEFININKTVRFYTKREKNTQVINSVCSIISEIRKGESRNRTTISNNLDGNARRLQREEINAQDSISRLGKIIKKGSLIQAVLFDEETEEYNFLIAKIENKVFYEETTLNKCFGIDGENNKLWKSCLFSISIDEQGNIDVSDAKVFSDNGAKYWTDKFLELDPMSQDDKNTKKAFEQIDKALAAHIKPISPKDFWLLRNGLITYFRNQEFFDYDNMMENLFNNYKPEKIEETVYKEIIPIFENLPDKKKFERQFHVVPKELKARVKKVYNINTGIELNFTWEIEDLKNTIKSYEENGQKYLSIKIKETEENNKELYDAFL